ncbi:hypothetical protein ABH926_006134 [Catenulispora sp. GP43]|uniref:hypothetical protein n=1 Tax=Catenulispora sp. GP43 TaxID=3156263 RepID=UPI0035124CB1
MRRAIRRTIQLGIAIPLLAGVTTFGSTATAFAGEDAVHVAIGGHGSPDDYDCYAQLDTTKHSDGTYYVKGEFDSDYGTPCAGWLERSSDGGHTYARVSNVYYTDAGTPFAETGEHWDGSSNSVLSRVCIRYNYNPSSAVVCSRGW